jgi:hypothetical protein
VVVPTHRPQKPESRWRLSQYLILTRGFESFLIRAVRDHNGGTSTRSILNLEKAPNSSLNFQADHPAVIFQVVGQSRDDVLTVVQAGGHHPGSQFAVEI